MDKRKIAGIVLAGGRSSRMGKNKALLEYNGTSLLNHMMVLLQKAGLSELYVSGTFDGCKAIPDRQAYEGPACAMYDVWAHLESKAYEAVLYVPVDMPLLSFKALELLLAQEEGAYFEEHYLPAFIPTSKFSAYSKQQERSVRALLNVFEIKAVPLPASLKNEMFNANTPENWAEVTRS